MLAVSDGCCTGSMVSTTGSGGDLCSNFSSGRHAFNKGIAASRTNVNKVDASCQSKRESFSKIVCMPSSDGQYNI